MYLIFHQQVAPIAPNGRKDIIDPIGFAKTIPQNYELLNNLRIFETLNCPILGGISRKTMIFRPLELHPIWHSMELPY